MFSNDPIQSRRKWSGHFAALAYSDFEKLWTASCTAGAASDEAARGKYPDGWQQPLPYIRIVPQPK